MLEVIIGPAHVISLLTLKGTGYLNKNMSSFTRSCVALNLYCFISSLKDKWCEAGCPDSHSFEVDGDLVNVKSNIKVVQMTHQRLKLNLLCGCYI